MISSEEYIDRRDALVRFVERVRGAEWIAVDTEFMREKTYYPELCLVQVATPDVLACIDPIAIDDLTPLLDLLFDPTLTKVFHAADQDLEMFYTVSGRVPAPVFDTQLAATLAGRSDHIGYGRLVAEMLGVELDKAHTRADWHHRPLTPEVLDYAADDVRYLSRLYPALRDDLSRRGRLNWLDEDFAALADARRYRTEPSQAWRRVKGLERLRPAQQQVLARLAEWREAEAMRANRPRRWILKDEVLVDLARRQPRDRAGLANRRDLPPTVVDRHADALLAAIGAGHAREPVALTTPPARLSADGEAIVDLLMACLRSRAGAHEVSPATVGNRRELEQMVRGARDLAILHGWRRRIAGATLLEVIEGQSTIGVDDGRLVIEAR